MDDVLSGFTAGAADGDDASNVVWRVRSVGDGASRGTAIPQIS